MGSETMTMEQLYSLYPESYINATLIALVVGCLFAAFFSFRLFKFTVVTYGVCVGFLFGLAAFGMLTGNVVVGLIIGVLLAVVLGILSLKFCKIMIYLYGASLGAEIGFDITLSIFEALGLQSAGEIVGAIVAVLFAVVGSILLYKYFKPYTIIGTSIVGSLMAVSCLYLLIFGENEAAIEAFSILWLALTAVSMYCQFKMCENYELDL